MFINGSLHLSSTQIKLVLIESLVYAGNTGKGQHLFCTKFIHVFDMADLCHGISNGIKDICVLEPFKHVCVNSCNVSQLTLTCFDRSFKICGVSWPL